MIRVIPPAKIIIPRGDTGVAPIYSTYPLINVDMAVFSAYDKLTHNTIISKEAEFTCNNYLMIFFDEKDTEGLEPGTYYWDIKLYTGMHFDEEGNFTYADQVNSLFSAYKLPKLLIKEVPNHG